MKDMKEILKLARQEVKKNWIKGELEDYEYDEYYKQVGNDLKYCALGAIGKHTGHFVPGERMMEYTDVDLGAAIVLACTIDPNFRQELEDGRFFQKNGELTSGFIDEVHSKVYYYNDSEFIKQEDVKNRFSEAIEKVDELKPLINQVYNAYEKTFNRRPGRVDD